ncbi:MAG: cation:proton antiporter [Candidatus Bathyarchaeia archaeon]
MSETAVAFALAGIIMLAGFITSIIFKKSGIPDSLFLILIGVVFGPLLNIISPKELLPLTPFFGSLALTLILFQGGLSMRIHEVLSLSITAAALGFLYVTFAILFVSFFGHIFLRFSWIEAMILGSMMAGTCSVIIVPLLSKLNVPDEVKTMLSLESVVSDVLNIILVMSFLKIYLQGSVNLQNIASALVSEFAIGIFCGFLLGLLWIKILNAIYNQEYVYILTIAALFFCYSGTEFLGGSGSLSALLFGLILGNYEMANRLGIKINAKSISKVIENIRRFQDEMVFLIRSFFLVILGLIYSPSTYGLIVAVVIIIINLTLRYLATRILIRGYPLCRYRGFMTLMCGTGLANATISLLVYNKMLELQNPLAPMYPLIVTNTIIINNAITALTPITLRKYLASRKGLHKQETLMYRRRHIF